MANIRRTGGKKQKVVKTQKEKCDKTNLYATINLAALDKAAQDLKPNSFKLWIYFSKNQNNYEFALSSKAIERDFGIKKDAYDGAIKELMDKGYLVKRPNTDEENYYFYELPLVVKTHNEDNFEESLVVKTHNPLVVKTHKGLQEKTTTPCGKKPQQILQDNTINNIKDTTTAADAAKGTTEQVCGCGLAALPREGLGYANPLPEVVEKEWVIERYNDCIPCANGLYLYKGKYYKVG